MTVHFIEPLGYTDNAADLVGGRYVARFFMTTNTMPVSSRPCFYSGGFADRYITTDQFSSMGNTFFLGFRYYVDAVDVGSLMVMQDTNASNDVVGSIGLEPGNFPAYYANNSGSGTHVAICDQALAILTEYYLGFLVTLSTGSTGSVAFYIDGRLVNTSTGHDLVTDTSVFTSLRIGASWASNSPGASAYTGDIYVATAAPPGEVAVDYLAANGDGGVTDWTPSAGSTNYLMVDETDPDDDTTYTSATTTGNRDELGVVNTSADGTFLAIQPQVRIRKTGAETETISLGTRSTGSEDLAAGQTIPSTYQYIVGDFSTLDPASTAWTQSGVDAAEVVYVLTS